MRRAKVSTPPPGDTGTTMRIGWLGKLACACTIRPGASTAPVLANSDIIASRRFMGMVGPSGPAILYYCARQQWRRGSSHSRSEHEGRIHHGGEKCDPYART